MNNKTWITLAILGALVALFFAVQTERAVPEASLELAPIANLERIEIMAPAESDRPELIALERRQGQWWLVRPTTAKVEPHYDEYFQSVFASTLSTDDLVIDADRAASYDLTEEQAVLVALFAAGADRPSRELLVGRQMEVEQTGAARTFIKKPGGDVIYRAQAPFGDLVRLSVDELRESVQEPGDEQGPELAEETQEQDDTEIQAEEIDHY